MSVIKEYSQTSLKAFCAADATAKAKTAKLCDCPNSKPGKINLDISAHEFDCWIRRRLQTKHYIVDTSVMPKKIRDGYSLGVALTN